MLLGLDALRAFDLVAVDSANKSVRFTSKDPDGSDNFEIGAAQSRKALRHA